MAAKKKADEEKSVKKSSAMGLSREERAAALIADVNKHYRGRVVIKSASEYRLPWMTKRLPTGLLTLDLALKGGWPAGGLSHVIGRRSAGKTLLAWHTVRQLQSILGEKMMVLLAMTEMPADRSQARLAGVKISLGEDEIIKMNEARKRKGEPPLTKKEIETNWPQVGTIHELHAMSAEDFYDQMLRAVDENIYHLIVLDSIGNILAAAEQENDSVHDKTYGGTSGPNTTFLKKMTNLLTMEADNGEVRDTTILAINQVRDNINDPNKKYKASGGNSLEHAKLVDLYLESGGLAGDNQSVYTVDGWKQQFVPTGKEVNWRIEKGKAGMHEGERGRFAFLYSTSDIDFHTDTIVAGITHGVIEQAGAWLGVRDPNKPAEYMLRAQGKDAFVKALIEDIAESRELKEISVLDYIRDECFKKCEIDIKYTGWK